MARVLLILLVLIIAVPAIAVGLNRLARHCWHEVIQTQQAIDQQAAPLGNPSKP